MARPLAVMKSIKRNRERAAECQAAEPAPKKRAAKKKAPGSKVRK